ncbi:MAG: hypothetical protein WBC19_05910, partial [Pyrinomonadaceae bacterium]
MFQELAKVNIHLIIDKSLFQSLPKKAFTPLDRYFYLVIPPILIKEILGDLGKNTSPEIIAGLADRFGMHSIVCQDHRFLLANSLIGNETSMDGRIPPAGMTPVVTADGMAGYNVRR